jgi:hypothetical protein
MLDAKTMIENIRQDLNEPTADFWTDPNILEKLNEGQNDMEDHITHDEEDYFGLFFDAPAIINNEYFELPEIVKVIRLLEDAQFQVTRIAQESRAFEGQDNIVFAQTGYSVFGQRVYIDPQPIQVSAGTFKIWGIISLPDLLFDAVPQAATASSITFPADASIFDYHYIDTRIKITEGPGIGEINKVITYDGSTKIAGVENNWVQNPTTASKFSTYSRIPFRYHRLLQTYAVMECKKMAGDDPQPWAVKYDQGISNMTSNLQRTRGPRFVQSFDAFDGIQDWAE